MFANSSKKGKLILLAGGIIGFSAIYWFYFQKDENHEAQRKISIQREWNNLLSKDDILGIFKETADNTIEEVTEIVIQHRNIRRSLNPLSEDYKKSVIEKMKLFNKQKKELY